MDEEVGGANRTESWRWEKQSWARRADTVFLFIAQLKVAIAPVRETQGNHMVGLRTRSVLSLLGSKPLSEIELIASFTGIVPPFVNNPIGHAACHSGSNQARNSRILVFSYVTERRQCLMANEGAVLSYSRQNWPPAPTLTCCNHHGRDATCNILLDNDKLLRHKPH